MTNLHSASWGLLAMMALQFTGAAILAVKLPRTEWAFRVLCAMSAMADATGAFLVPGTTTYAYVYWAFRIIELNWAIFATSRLCCRLIPQWCSTEYVPMGVGLAMTLANWIPRSNHQMQIYQTFMCLLLAGTALFASGLAFGMRKALISLAIGLAFALQLVCTVLWRAVGYTSEVWIISWIIGLVLLGWSARQPMLLPTET
jgi:hypothetical protein